MATTMTGLSKTAWGGWQSRLQPRSGSPTYPIKPPSSLNLKYQGKFKWQAGDIENTQLTRIKTFIPKTSTLANVVYPKEPQDQEQHFTPPTYTPCLAKLNYPASILGPANNDKLFQSPAHPALTHKKTPSQRTACTVYKPTVTVYTTPDTLGLYHPTPNPNIPITRSYPNVELGTDMSGGSSLRQ